MRNEYGEMVDENGCSVSPLDDDYYRYKHMEVSPIDDDYNKYAEDGEPDCGGIKHFQD